MITEKRMKTIIVMGGKGGVGKSSMAVCFARGLAERDFKVLIVDTDITGACVRRLLGEGTEVELRDQMFIPAKVSENLYAISIKHLGINPLFWSGEALGSAVIQLINLTDKSGIDYMILDAPPGANQGIQKTLKEIKIDGALLVTLGSQLSEDVVRDTMEMLRETQTPIIGEVKNMTSIECECGRSHKIFNYDFNLGIPVIAKVLAYTDGKPITIPPDSIPNMIRNLRKPTILPKKEKGLKQSLTSKAFKMLDMMHRLGVT